MVVYSGPRQPPFLVFDNSYYLAANWPFGLVTPYSLKQDHALCVSKHVYLLSIHIYMYVENQIHTWKSEDNLQGLVPPSAMWTASCQAWQHTILQARPAHGPFSTLLEYKCQRCIFDSKFTQRKHRTSFLCSPFSK